MSKVKTGFSMSLDGFVAGLHDSAEKPLGEGGDGLFAWYGAGDTDVSLGQFTVRISKASAMLMQEAMTSSGVLVSGRRTFDLTNGWGGHHPIGVPVIVVTHSLPQQWIDEFGQTASLSFVTDGLESAMKKAREVAGTKDIIAGSPSIAKQCLKAGLLDEVNIDLVPLLIGRGVRLFEPTGGEPLQLERVRVVEAPGVTHLLFRVVK